MWTRPLLVGALLSIACNGEAPPADGSTSSTGEDTTSGSASSSTSTSTTSGGSTGSSSGTGTSGATTGTTGVEVTGDPTSGPTGSTSNSTTEDPTSSSTGGPFCGDGILDPDLGEECDQGPGNGEGKACLEGCVKNVCGDGDAGPAEECDDGNDVETDLCLSTCIEAACGDGLVFEGQEECDDGNLVAGDGCDPTCIVEVWTHVGPAINVPIAELYGWTLCHSELYSAANPLADMMKACSGTELLVACRKVGSDTLDVAAHAPSAEVWTVTPYLKTHTANGSKWYFRTDRALGFAPASGNVVLNGMLAPCDDGDLDDKFRLCWETSGGKTFPKGRCGEAFWIEFGDGTQWERMLFTR